MKAIFILTDKKIKLYHYSDTVMVDIVCPRANIQNMLTTLGGHFISKKRIYLPYKHHAGETYSVKLKITLREVVKYLTPAISLDVLKADNYNQFRDVADWQVDVYQLKIDKLYLFGDCGKYIDLKSLTHTSYYNKFGRQILFPNKHYNNFGDKRYVCNAGVWYSNKKY